MNHPVNKPLIKKYLNGECNAAELLIMNEFLQRKDAQHLIDQVWAEEWEAFQEEDISDLEISRWKTSFEHQRSQVSSSDVKKLIPRRSFILRYAAIWAGLLLFAGTWYGVKTLQGQKEKTQAIVMLQSNNPMGQRSKIQLPDSSTVYLAGGSKLIYPERFSGNTREISLQGEAFFEVTKNPKKPFIIHTGDVQTRVLGTSFRINAFKGQPMMVEVATGKVRVDQLFAKRKRSLAVLTPGQSVKWDDKDARLGTVSVDDLKEWKNGRLVFNGATLSELTSVLERWYNVKIAFNDAEKAKHHLTITLTANVPITEIMDVLAGTARFKYQLKGNQITIN